MVQEADIGMTNMALGGMTGNMPKPGEHFIKFFHDAVQNTDKSNEAGRPIYDDVEFIEIRSPGNQTSVLIKEVNDYYKGMFPLQYQAWKSGDEEQIIGTPLKMWPIMTAGQIEELRYLGVLSVEQLAEMNDTGGGNIMGFQQLKRKAKLFLQAAEGNAATEKLASELEKRDNTIEVLNRQLSELGDKVDELMKAKTARDEEEA